MKLFSTTVAFLNATSVIMADSDFVIFDSDELGSPMAIVTIDAPKVFPDSPANLTGFNIEAGYTNYNETFFHNMANDLSPAAPLETRVGAVVGALYGKEYVESEPDMAEDFHRLFQMAHPVTAMDLIPSRNAYWTWSKNNAVSLAVCAGFMSCISGYTCNFYVTINQAPRSRCEVQGGQNCCMTWANYNVKAGFFSITWAQCYNSRPDDNESCEGHDNGSGNGGDVCFSNRADGCT
ncbi:hypothetical protein F4679DRAFT_577897 [Xylaria curta]|nr:hypothetical protein F4679DRAFT_577897 [Xylaria curta]